MSFELALNTTIPVKFKHILEKLQSGNSRFMMGMRVGDITPSRREELLKGQYPIATVLTCSDSRVVPVFIFDQGLGDLFVVRTAGNIADALALGSIEYSCEHLRSPLLVVLGHTRCGAVSETCKETELPGFMKELGKLLKPIVDSCRLSGKQDLETLINAAIVKNVEYVINMLLEKSEILKNLVEMEELLILGALYRMETGKVDFMFK